MSILVGQVTDFNEGFVQVGLHSTKREAKVFIALTSCIKKRVEHVKREIVIVLPSHLEFFCIGAEVKGHLGKVLTRVLGWFTGLDLLLERSSKRSMEIDRMVRINRIQTLGNGPSGSLISRSSLARSASRESTRNSEASASFALS